MTVADAVDYLASLGVVLWPGESWDLTDPKQRAKAAEWLAHIVGAIDEQR